MTPEQRFAERAERIKAMLIEGKEKLNELSIMLNYHSMTVRQFESTQQALRLGTGELELF